MKEREELNYVVEDKILAEVLGRQNFSNKESAILELVKNAYDAGAKNLNIIFSNSKDGVELVIIDDGSGMNDEDIRKAWMHVGKSTRGYDNEKSDRVYAGSKGIGRFALSRLGEEVEMLTKQKNEDCLVWTTDWESSFLSKKEDYTIVGTKLIIKQLRDRWNRRSVKPLKEYLSNIYNDTAMNINIEFEDEKATVKKMWNNPTIGENYVTGLQLQYSAEKKVLHCRIESDEFNDEAIKFASFPSIKEYYKELNMFDHLNKDISVLIEEDIKNSNKQLSEQDVKNIKINQVLEEIGSFEARFYFSLSSMTSNDYEWFEYKHKVLLNRYKNGVILYRNAFGIDSFEGRNDWLGISKRASKSPAAASHPTGNWRVRTNQISGYVEIDKKRNHLIEDLSNRQGIVENIYFEVFKKIILEGIGELETFRQGIIRNINTYKKNLSVTQTKETKETKEAVKILNQLRGNFENVKKLTEADLGKVILEFDRRETETKNIEREKKEIEEKSRYESQLLNVLATSQLKINSLGHEIKNDRNSMGATPNDLEEAIKEIVDWDELNDEDIPFYQNIPKLLDTLKKNTLKILNLTDNILEEMEKERFEKHEYNLNDVLNEITIKWKNQYSWLSFKNNVDNLEKVLISYDQLMVVFDNLILNSIQQNEEERSLEIKINIYSDDDMISIEYQDNGKGLDKKYISNPMKILEVHESTRKKGHGLGMWMVNNTINKLNGQIERINGENGFYLSAYIEI
ncbi:sensor histidine kinase [Enterococcus durans]|uniref:sensor histidine kinase n=1 Tax=Enterococcus durans TaxID=53345 RepID=UPI001430776C|nr:sensor histidine kinase [Enterococcus durans]NJE63045.1 sensor histidine kinase [Enterococcus durans]